MKKVLKNLDAYIAGAMMIVTIVLVIVNVITRKLFNYIIIWSEEIATSCFVYSVFIGAAYAYRKHQHVGVDLLVERLPAGVRRVVHLITNALLVIINGYITVLSVQFIQSSWIKRMPITKLPSSAKGCIPAEVRPIMDSRWNPSRPFPVSTIRLSSGPRLTVR